jgi:predicted DCC family thiol-disulfide oxidoreductase YuxK
MREHGLDPARPTTLLLIVGDRAHSSSDALVELTRFLRIPWRWLGICRWIPRRMRDRVYRFVARNRYRWFGRRDTCSIPPGEE